jgi:methionyl-tRNA formyltransferase
MDTKLKIIFFGTPSFAAGMLEYLVKSGFEVVCVVTSPDKPAGRGLQLRESEVKKTALSFQLPLLQPQNLKDENFLTSLKNFHADIFIVVAFRMLPESVWSIPPYGTYNIHASLLPAYRGAAPIQHAILNGETEAGVTLFKINQTIDAGLILSQKKVSIEPEDNFRTLHDKLMVAGKELLCEELTYMQHHSLSELQKRFMQQDESRISYAPKITREDLKINWKNPAIKIHNQIRAFSPVPGAECSWKKNDSTHIKLKIFKTIPVASDIPKNLTTSEPGTFFIDKNKRWIVITGDAKGLELLEIQAEGKKRMSVTDFLNGYPSLQTGIFE